MSLIFEIELPPGYETSRLPKTLTCRLQTLLDLQDSRGSLTPEERDEAQELVTLAKWLSLMQLKAKRLSNENHINP